MTGRREASGWRRFWERGGWWRSLLLAAAYYGLYRLGSLIFVPLSRSVDPSNDALLRLVGALPIALGGVLIVLFAWSVGWLRELFGPQPIRGRWWMWAAVVVVLLTNALHFASLDYGEAGAAVVIAWLVTGLFIGFAEETLTRGLVVTLLRRRGYREIWVAVLSALLFSALHAGNLLSGQALVVTAVQLVYTFAFGVCMYLALRVTGRLIWPILLHATTDPAIFLDAAYPTQGALAGIAGLGNFVVIAAGFVLLFFIRGKVEPVEVTASEDTATREA